jgi:choline kinase
MDHPGTSSWVREAIVLAAGNGDRFRQPTAQSKLLAPIAGTPLLTRTLASAARAGITQLHLVLGYDAARVADLAWSSAPAGLALHTHLNRDWHRENGLSVLTARRSLGDRPFALLMGDHLFDAAALERLLSSPRRDGETLLCVDPRPAPPAVAAEATRVRLDGDGRIVAIAKDLEPYDALDTGLFVCDASLFTALDAARRTGDTTLSAGIRYLSDRRRVTGVDVGDGRWCDVDTAEDVGPAAQVVAALERPRPGPTRRAAVGSAV